MQICYITYSIISIHIWHKQHPVWLAPPPTSTFMFVAATALPGVLAMARPHRRALKSWEHSTWRFSAKDAGTYLFPNGCVWRLTCIRKYWKSLRLGNSWHFPKVIKLLCNCIKTVIDRYSNSKGPGFLHVYWSCTTYVFQVVYSKNDSISHLLS